jgi:hypothetical protein
MGQFFQNDFLSLGSKEKTDGPKVQLKLGQVVKVNAFIVKTFM